LNPTRQQASKHPSSHPPSSVLSPSKLTQSPPLTMMDPVADNSEEISTLSGMFPDKDREYLGTILEAHNGNVERCVEFILSDADAPPSSNDFDEPSALREQAPAATLTNTRDAPSSPRHNIVYETGDPAADAARIRQLDADEQMARQLQLQETQQYRSAREASYAADHPGGGIPAAEETPWKEVSAAATTAMEKMRLAGTSAYNSAAKMYKEYMEEGEGGSARGTSGYQRVAGEESSVITSPNAATQNSAPPLRGMLRHGSVWFCSGFAV